MDIQQALDDVAAHWNVAAAPWNAEALAAIYTEDALFFGGRPGHSVGTGPILDYFKSYEGVINAARMVLVESQLRRLASDCVLSQGFVDFHFELATGQSTQSLVRATLVLLHDGQGRWRIAQHHFSPTPEAPPLGQALSQ